MHKILQVATNSAKETQKIGFNLAQSLKSNQTIALSGDLGAGKTTFLQGLALGLGIKEKVNSPTFNILKRYNLQKRNKTKNILSYFYHIDAYRLHDSKDLIALGWEEMLSSKNSLIAIEWAEKVKDILPTDLIQVRLQHVNEISRKITISISSESKFEMSNWHKG